VNLAHRLAGTITRILNPVKTGGQEMATVQVRYIVNDVDAAIGFYCGNLGFHEDMHPGPAFAMLSRGGLRLVLSAPNPQAGGGQAMPDGTRQTPGGWNRLAIEVADLEATVELLREAGAHFRNEIVTGVGGKQIIVDDPAGNPVELFQPTRPEARFEREAQGPSLLEEFVVRPIGHIRSELKKLEDAPLFYTQGAPNARLELNPDVQIGLDRMQVGHEIIVLTWLHRARRDVLQVHPQGNPAKPLTGVFLTRSPDRPNPIGLHRARVLEIRTGSIVIGPIEAIDGTPVLDIKPVVEEADDF
jgi:tRNA-Thr(GGU) m(6)t(6)A37 methyltransferase TsaA